MLAQGSPDARIVVPDPIAGDVGRVVGADRVVGVAAGRGGAADRRRLREGRARLARAEPAHGYSTGDGRFLGYVVTTPSLRLYHSGDTLVTEELVEHARATRASTSRSCRSTAATPSARRAGSSAT